MRTPPALTGNRSAASGEGGVGSCESVRRGGDAARGEKSDDGGIVVRVDKGE